jgi:hypothetical protein
VGYDTFASPGNNNWVADKPAAGEPARYRGNRAWHSRERDPRAIQINRQQLALAPAGRGFGVDRYLPRPPIRTVALAANS